MSAGRSAAHIAIEGGISRNLVGEGARPSFQNRICDVFKQTQIGSLSLPSEIFKKKKCAPHVSTDTFRRHLKKLESWRHALQSGATPMFKQMSMPQKVSDLLFACSMSPASFHRAFGRVNALLSAALGVREVEIAHRTYK